MKTPSYVAGSGDTDPLARAGKMQPAHRDRGRTAGQDLCSTREIALIADTFRILANPTRLHIVRCLTRGELCVSDLAAAVGASHSAVSHQLRQLRQMRLVRYRRHGKLTFYSLDDDHAAELFELGLEHVRERLP